MFDIEKDLSFVILLTELRFASLRTTATTINNNFNNPDCVCVVPKDSNKDELKVVRGMCQTYEGGTTISSMINKGLEKSKRPWSLILVSGNIIKYNPVLKYKRFLESEKDVMYRVVNKTHWKWEDSSIHGMMINKNAMKEVGIFPEEEESLQFCKLMWAERAMKKGYKFKGLVGVKLI